MLLRFSENPGRQIVDTFLSSSLTSSPLISIGMGMMKKRFGGDFLFEGIELMFSPRLTAVREGSHGMDAILYEENKRIEALRARFEAVANTLRGFIKDKSSEEESQEKKTPFAALSNLLKRRKIEKAASVAEETESAMLDEIPLIEAPVQETNDDIYAPSPNTISLDDTDNVIAISDILGMIGFSSELPIQFPDSQDSNSDV